MDRKALVELARAERAVVTREELASVGVSSSTISDRLRSGEWSRPLRGVYILEVGLPDFDQRMTCVIKWARGATFAFASETAAYLHGLQGRPPKVLGIVAPRDSSLRSSERCHVRRSRVPIDVVGDPPRTSLEQTVIDLIGEAPTTEAALEYLIRGIQKKLNIERFLMLVRSCQRVRHRAFIEMILEVTSDGVESHLELAYVRDVERSHGIPRSEGQRRELVRGRWIRSDRWHEEFGVRAELDGELAHPGRMTDADVMRDNDVRLTLDEITLRYRWPQVANTPCLVAAQVTRALQMRGWSGAPKSCGPDCEIERHIRSFDTSVT